jgi:hypothetical protein
VRVHARIDALRAEEARAARLRARVLAVIPWPAHSAAEIAAACAFEPWRSFECFAPYVK